MIAMELLCIALMLLMWKTSILNGWIVIRSNWLLMIWRSCENPVRGGLEVLLGLDFLVF